MALITSNTFHEEKPMTDRIATEDIVRQNEAGQNVVVVAAGDVIPDGIDVPKSKSEPDPDETAAAPVKKASTRKSSR